MCAADRRDGRLSGHDGGVTEAWRPRIGNLSMWHACRIGGLGWHAIIVRLIPPQARAVYSSGALSPVEEEQCAQHQVASRGAWRGEARRQFDNEQRTVVTDGMCVMGLGQGLDWAKGCRERPMLWKGVPLPLTSAGRRGMGAWPEGDWRRLETCVDAVRNVESGTDCKRPDLHTL